MYNMTQNTLPAPYELNQGSQPQISQPMQAQSFARGGSASRSKGLEPAHVNRHELAMMDHAQGGAKIDRNGVRSYAPLEALIKNPHIVHNIHKHYHHNRKHHAQGGYSPAMEQLREGGRNGDNELAMIGPHTHHLFNQLAGHATRNPNDGHPEYFDLSGAMSGLFNSVKGAAPGIMSGMGNMFNSAMPAMKNIAQAALPALMPMAQQALSNMGSAGQVGASMLPAAAQAALGPTPQNMNPMYQNMGQSLGQAAQAYAGGASPQQAFGQGVQNFGGNMGGGIGNAIQEAGQSFGQGNGFGPSMQRGMQRGFDEMGGRQGMMNSARNVGMGGLQGGWGGARQAAGNEMNQYAQRMIPRPANMQQRYPQQQQQQYFPQYQQQQQPRYPQQEQYDDPYEIYG